MLNLRCRTALASVALGAALVGTLAPPATAQKPDVVTGGLANPRGLAFGPDGRLYVAEAGRGGKGPCIPAPEQGPPNCAGATGALTRVDVQSGRKRRIVKRLPSLAAQAEPDPGGSAVGPQDVSFQGNRAFFTVGLAADPATRAQLGALGGRFAVLYTRSARGRVTRVADLGAFEARKNPDAGQPSAEVDTNPFSVDASVRGRLLVTDAGGNDLLQVDAKGRVKTLAVFPFGSAAAPPQLGLPAGAQIPVQPVPTGVVRGRRGVAHVGQLTGFPFPMGQARVFRVKGANKPRTQASGFTTIVDVAAGRDGSLYVLQISTDGLAGAPGPGRLFRLAPGGGRSELAAGMLEQPTGVVVAGNGDVYVANRGTSATGGQIVRVSRSGSSGKL
jgi:sugar lactone lactonase YvrE